MTKPTQCEDGYLMSQADTGALMGLNQRTVSKAERSMIKKLKTALYQHNISEAEFLSYIKYSGL